jgi:hypothetical protein
LHSNIHILKLEVASAVHLRHSADHQHPILGQFSLLKPWVRHGKLLVKLDKRETCNGWFSQLAKRQSGTWRRE